MAERVLVTGANGQLGYDVIKELTKRNIECVGDEHDRNKGLENPFEENPGFKISKVVVVNYQLNQLITGYEC